MKKYTLLLPLLAVLHFTSCPSLGGGISSMNGASMDALSARAAIGRVEEAASGPLFEGEGGAELRIAVLAPRVQGAVPDYLPVYVQGLLNNNFKKYSAITLIDRQNLDQIIAEQDISVNGRFSDADFIKIGHLTNARYYVTGIVQKLSGDQYSLQLSVTDSVSGVPRATVIKNGLLGQFEGKGTLINEASAELLAQLGVRQTEYGRRTLLAGSAASVQAETGLARGITAQASGASVEALFNFTQSVAFDPSQMEALARLSTVSTAISGGTISQQIRGDFEARDRWVDIFKETAKFFEEHPPFEITFDPNLIEDGKRDYAKRTAHLAMRVMLEPSEAGFKALNTLLEGLEKTGRREDWGFSGWPLLDIQPKTAGTTVFSGKRSVSFKLDVNLLNENGKVLAKNSLTLTSGKFNFKAADSAVKAPEGSYGLLRFPNIKADDLTPSLTIQITALNNIPARTLNAAAYMRIAAGDVAERIIAASFIRVEGGTFQMGSNNGEDWEKPVHSVTVKSFYMGKYPVTQGEWQEVMGTNPSYFKGDTLPVEQVSWNDAVEYCNRRSRKEGLTLAYSGTGDSITCDWNASGYRLPTEAEWEYAARGGNGSPGNYTYSGSNNVDSVAWHSGNSGNTTHPVGTKAANSLGIYDMSGNVWEWCWDWYGNYSSSAQTDPRGASSGAFRVLRGGSWAFSAANVRSADRNYDTPANRISFLGFRLVRS